MHKTSIAWADFTVNPIRARNIETGSVGHFCERIAAGCTHCYAAEWNKRVRPVMFGEVPARDPETGKQRFLGTGLDYLPANRSKVEFFLDRSKLQAVYRRQKPAKIFWCDMTDLFGEWVPTPFIEACYAVMVATPQHVHQVLTKRPARRRELLLDTAFRDRVGSGAAKLINGMRGPVGPGSPSLIATMNLAAWNAGTARNIWEGTSASTQGDVERDLPDLLGTPGIVKFLSLEPLLGPVDLEEVKLPAEPQEGLRSVNPIVSLDVLNGTAISALNLEYDGSRRIDWVIVGGESGPKARPCDVAWIRSVRDQCKAAGVPCFVKQLGAYAILDPRYDRTISGWTRRLRDRAGADPSEWPEDLRVQEFPEARA